MEKSTQDLVVQVCVGESVCSTTDLYDERIYSSLYIAHYHLLFKDNIRTIFNQNLYLKMNVALLNTLCTCPTQHSKSQTV